MAVVVPPSAGFCILDAGRREMPAGRLLQYRHRVGIAMPLLQLIRSANVLTNIENDRPSSLISERLSTEQTGMLSRNRGMCERQPQVQQTSKNHHPSFPNLSPRACRKNERYVQRVGASSRVRRQQAKKIEGSVKYKG